LCRVSLFAILLSFLFLIFAFPGAVRGGEAAESECFAPDNNPVRIDARINPIWAKGFTLWTPEQALSPCTRPKGRCPLDTQQALPPCTQPKGFTSGH
jgi:hypothetical protein